MEPEGAIEPQRAGSGDGDGGTQIEIAGIAHGRQHGERVTGPSLDEEDEHLVLGGAFRGGSEEAGCEAQPREGEARSGSLDEEAAAHGHLLWNSGLPRRKPNSCAWSTARFSPSA